MQSNKMPTAVSDYTVPTTTAAAAATPGIGAAKKIIPKPAPLTAAAKGMSNGKAVHTQNEQQTVPAEHNDEFYSINLLNNDEKQPFIVKYRQKYYDITRFLKNHPGGINTLRGLKNSDMTTRFLHAPPHSDAAMYLMKEYEIKPQAVRQQQQQKENGLHRRHPQPANDDNNDNARLLGVVDHQQRQQQVFFEATTPVNGIELIADAVTQEDKINNNQLDESMEHLVDWSKAMLPQISHIARHYDEWVHKPVDRPLRLFGPTYLEVFTKTPWWVIPLFWVPVITKCLWNEYTAKWSQTSASGLSVLVINFIAGVLFWTFLEYILHRFVFHMKANNRPWLCTFHFLIHGLHHKVPFDSMRLVFPPLPGVCIATIIYVPLSYLLPHPRIVLAGALCGYLCYDLMHYYLHYGNPSLQHLTRFMYNMKRYHYQHHFAHQDMGYGISSPIWDMAFDTQIHLRKLRFSLRWR